MPDNNYQDIGEQVVNYMSTVTLTLYNNSSEPNRVDKTEYLTPASPASLFGTFKAPFNLTHPTVLITRPHLSIFNYVLIKFPTTIGRQDRYYFVTSMTAINADLFEVDLELDVLMTYKSAIADCTAFVERNEFEYNNLLIDEKRVIEAGIEISDIQISNNILVDSNIDDNTPSGIAAISGFAIDVVYK